jgi:hypothetical protein
MKALTALMVLAAPGSGLMKYTKRYPGDTIAPEFENVISSLHLL